MEVVESTISGGFVTGQDIFYAPTNPEMLKILLDQLPTSEPIRE